VAEEELALDRQPPKVPVVWGSTVALATAAASKWNQEVSEPAWGANLSSPSHANLTKAVAHLVEGEERCAQFPS
jgi:hypothetical protein